MSGAIWTFTVQFRRNGDLLGQSVESCSDTMLSDCTDQLVSDVKSAAGMGPPKVSEPVSAFRGRARGVAPVLRLFFKACIKSMTLSSSTGSAVTSFSPFSLRRIRSRNAFS